MVMFPCPAACTFFRLFESSVFFFYIYKSDISFVHFRFFVKKVKDSFGSGKCHNNAVKLLAYLINWHIEAFVKGEKACKPSKSKSAKAVYGKNAAENGTKYVAYISKLCYRWHQNICKFVGVICTFKEGVV